MVALAIASVMVFTSCHTEKTEYLDPDAPSGGSDDSKQELDIEIDASISGAMTKGVSMTIKYTDFDGKSDEVVLNKDFAGQSPLSLKLPFHAEGKGKEFAISVTTTKADITAYKTEKAPWNAICIINVKHNGKEDFQHSVKVTENPISLFIYIFFISVFISVLSRFFSVLSGFLMPRDFYTCL